MNLKYTIKNLFPASYLKRLGHHTFFLILVLLLACCKNQKPPVAVTEKDPDEIQFFSLSIRDLLKNRREVNLSEIAESAEYIELETTDESLLGPIANAIFTKEFIFVEQYDRPLAQFDMSGKFIRHIGRLGKGPEEYTMIREFSIDEERRKIYIQPNYIRVIQVYSFEGNFLKTIRLPEDRALLCGAGAAYLCAIMKLIEEQRNSFSPNKTVMQKSCRQSGTITSGRIIAL